MKNIRTAAAIANDQKQYCSDFELNIDVITAEIYCLDKNGINGAVEQLNRELPPFKRIGRVVFRDEEFEKTTTRKIKRYKSGKEVSHV